MNRHQLLSVLKDLGVRRSIMTEVYSRVYLKVQVPKKNIVETFEALAPMMPVGVSMTVSVLPFWKCWFIRHQHYQEFD